MKLNISIKKLYDVLKQHPELLNLVTIETRFGYLPIEACDITAKNSEVIEVETESGKKIGGSPDHLLLSNNIEWVKIKDLSLSNILFSKNGVEKIKKIKRLKQKEDLYDIQVKNKHEYYANDIVSHNSTICQSIHYAIFGESIGNKVKKTNLVNKANKKNMEVSLEFEKDGIEYVIERGRSPEYLRFLVNGEDLAQGENKDTQEDINKVIGMSSDLFCQTSLLTASTQTFMEMNAAGQREIIEQLLGVQILSDKAEKLKEKVKEVKQIISNEEVRLQTVKSANEEIIKRNENQKINYQNKLNQFEEERKSNIAKFENIKQQLQQIDIEKELEAHKKNQERLDIIEDNKKKEIEYDSLKIIISENENKIEIL